MYSDYFMRVQEQANKSTHSRTERSPPISAKIKPKIDPDASLIYNPKRPKKVELGSNPFVEEIKIKVFPTSTKSNLDKKCYSQQQSPQQKVNRTARQNDSSLLNCSTLLQSEKSSQPKQITIQIHKKLDQRFYNFIKEYGMVIEDQKSTTDSRMSSSDQRFTYYTCQNTPPPQKNFRTKLFNNVN